MSDLAAAPEATNVSPNGVDVGEPSPSMSYEERVNAAFGDGAGPVDGAEAPAVETAPSDAERAKRIEENRAKLASFKEAERRRVDEHTLKQENERLRAQLAAGTKPDNRIDPSTLNEEQFFSLAEQLKIPGEKLRDWLKLNAERPELATIRKEVDPKITTLEEQNRKLQERLDALEGNLSSAERQAEESKAANEMFAFTRTNAATSPLAARFLDEHGSDEFYTLAISASANVPPGSGPQAILDEIEDRLTQLGRIYSPKAGSPQRQLANQTRPNPAAAKAPTHVTNTLASQRSSVVDEETAWAQLPFEERSARLFR